ncbi:MAG TPA: MoaD/ThiS family protein [Caulobacteraceae bacterium]
MARVLLFGRLSDIAGWHERPFEAASLSSLKRLIADQAPDLATALDAPGVQTAVDQIVVRGEAVLSEGAEVAFLPPMSGG